MFCLATVGSSEAEIQAPPLGTTKLVGSNMSCLICELYSSFTESYDLFMFVERCSGTFLGFEGLFILIGVYSMDALDEI